MDTGTLTTFDKYRLWHYGCDFIISDRNLRDLKFKDLNISDLQEPFTSNIEEFFNLFAVPIHPK